MFVHKMHSHTLKKVLHIFFFLALLPLSEANLKSQLIYAFLTFFFESNSVYL